MRTLDEDEQRQIMTSPPRGTFALILLYGMVMAAAWIALYFGRFLAHGPVTLS
jgi:hypothetical protein